MQTETYDEFGVNTKNSFNTQPKKPRKPRATRTKASRAKESRTFPKWREGMTTLDYINAYHAANASVYLTQVTYICQ